MGSKKDIQIILELSRIVKSDPDLTETFKATHNYLPYFIDFDVCEYCLKEEEYEIDLHSVLLELDGGCVSLIGQKKHENILIEKVEATKECWRYSDIVPTPHERQNSVEEGHAGDLPFAMGAPIVAGGELWGIIYLGREGKKGDFCNEELKKLELIANLAGIKIQNFLYFRRDTHTCLSSQAELDIDIINELDEEYYGWHLLESLIAGIAREVRNPLANVKMAFYSLARNVAKNPGVQPDLEQMEYSLQRMDKALNFLLSLSRNQDLNLVKLDINKLLDEALELVRTTFEPEVLVVRNYATLPPVIIDKEKMITVLSKIMENAVDAMPVGGTLQISTFKEDDNVYIIIEDDGVGVDEKIRYCLFEPFVGSKPQNTGLGLTICKRIIEMHGGRITVSNNTGKGTVVSLVLPLYRNAC